MEEVYKPKNKERTWRDRQNKLNQILNYLGEETLTSEFELTNEGRQKIKKMLKVVFESSNAHEQVRRCRQFLKQIFKFGESKEYFPTDQNPVFEKFDWEGLKHEKRGNAYSKWKDVSPFLQSINKNSCNASRVTDLATKAHLVLCTRTRVVVRLEWDWYDAEEKCG